MPTILNLNQASCQCWSTVLSLTSAISVCCTAQPSSALILQLSLFLRHSSGAISLTRPAHFFPLLPSPTPSVPFSLSHACFFLFFCWISFHLFCYMIFSLSSSASLHSVRSKFSFLCLHPPPFSSLSRSLKISFHNDVQCSLVLRGSDALSIQSPGPVSCCYSGAFASCVDMSYSDSRVPLYHSPSSQLSLSLPCSHSVSPLFLKLILIFN